MLHDYAGCQSLACALCDAYGDGYSRGKASAVFEILNVGTDHLSGCGCTPCKVRRRLESSGSRDRRTSRASVPAGGRVRRP